MDGLSASVDEIDDSDDSSSNEGGMTPAGDASDGGEPEAGEAKGFGEEFAANPIYGSREVRWQLLSLSPPFLAPNSIAV